jgi:hypothetical protein
MTEITNAFLYIPDPDKSRALFNASLYFGNPDTDPTIASNQKLVTGIFEGGSVSLSQPISTNSGGTPTYNGNPVRLSISGDYSFKALDRLGALKYYAENVSNPEEGSAGFSGVVVTEPQTLSAGQVDVTFANVGANESVFYHQTTIGDQGFLALNIDYTIKNSTTITLTSSKNAGDRIIGRQNDPTGQLVQVNDDAAALLVFPALSDAQASAVAGNLIVGDTVTLNGNAAEGDGLGGDKYKVITTAFSNDDVNYLNLNGTLQLQLQDNYYRFQNYAEKIATASISAGVLTIDLNDGLVQQISLTENVTSFTIVNFNPSSSYASTFTLKLAQDAIGGRGVTLSGFNWANGLAPTITATANAYDRLGFTTEDGGATWDGFVVGQNIT